MTHSPTQRLLKEVYISCKWKERLFVAKAEKPKEELDAELVAAVTQNDVVTVAKLVASGADVNALVAGDASHNCVLHCAYQFLDRDFTCS